jgi:hypothetical protein
MKLVVKGALLLSLVTFVLAAPVANALIITGHSPIVLLVTDPSGNQFGCKTTSCTLSSVCSYPCENTDFVNKISPTATYVFCPTNYPNCPSINIPNAETGTWTVQYIGTGPGTTYITAELCPNDVCSTINVIGTPDYPVTINPGTPVSFTISVTPTGFSVPQFPFGLLLVVGLLAPALLVMSKLRSRRLVGSQEA